MHHEARRVQQGERGFCTGLPRLGALHSSASPKDCSSLESNGLYRARVAAGQASALRTTGRQGNGGHPALLLPQAARGSFQGALLEPANRLLLVSSCHSCGRIWLDGR